MKLSVENMICDYISQTRYENLSKESIEIAKKSILDNLGAILVGLKSKSAQKAINIITNMGGVKEAHVIGWNNTMLPAASAALCNGILSVARDIDDCLDYNPLHPTNTIIPVMLALAENKNTFDNRPLSGKDFITSVIVGQDINIRFSLALDYSPENASYDNTFKILGPTAALANSLRMDSQKIQKLFGMAIGYGTTLNGQSVIEGADTVKLFNGMMAYSAYLYAKLSYYDFCGPQNSLTGRSGYLSKLHPNYKKEYLLKDLGKYFYNSYICHKPFAACRAVHNQIGMACEVSKEIDYRDIVKLEVRISPVIYELLKIPRYLEIRPTESEIAELSIPFTVATALIKSRFFLEELELENLDNIEVLELARKIDVIPDNDCYSIHAVGKSIMNIHFNDGSIKKLMSDVAYGSIEKPMNYYDGILDKFRKCVEYSEMGLSDDDISLIADKIYRIEELEDVSEILDKLI